MELMQRLQEPAKIRMAPRVNYGLPNNRGESLRFKSQFDIAPKIGDGDFKSLRV
jgi:hypothetical protein